ncbi:hypothetical protein [Streptomyces sp. NPDC048473]|uniref:hypothetical protein n=1 Tax=unclassified Streptomyces TaxID=2593676 RepID=UPI003724BF48
MMTRDTDDHTDFAASIVSLTAQATLLRARIEQLHEELASVSARIDTVSDSLLALHHPVVHAGADSDGARCGVHGRRSTAGGWEAGPAGTRRPPKGHPH